MKQWFKKRLSVRHYELLRAMLFEWYRWWCRIRMPRKYKTDKTHLHLGCGDRKIDGWLNVDVIGSDVNIDIAKGKFPFADHQFAVIVSQHVIEHLTLQDELIPMLKECHRIMQPGGEFWIATPDLEKLVQSYITHKNADMIADRQTRIRQFTLGDIPTQHFMNDMFHQQMEHRNLFDFELLHWTLQQAGFQQIDRVSEVEMLQRFPAFPSRHDDYQSLYVRAIR